MQTRVKVTVNGRDFNDGFDVDGVRWKAHRVDGWEGPSADLSSEGMASQDGDAVGRHRLRGRALTVVGTIYAPPERHWAAHAALLALSANLMTPRDIVVHELDTPKVAHYVRGGPPRVRLHDGRLIEFELPLLCPDPRKYATTATEVTIPAGGSVLVTGAGNYPGGSPVTVTTGGTVDVSNSVTGERLSTVSAVGSGSVFDGSARTARTSGGADLFHVLAPGFEWLHVVPGDQAITNDGTDPAVLTFRDSWL